MVMTSFSGRRQTVGWNIDGVYIRALLKDYGGVACARPTTCPPESVPAEEPAPIVTEPEIVETSVNSILSGKSIALRNEPEAITTLAHTFHFQAFLYWFAKKFNQWSIILGLFHFIK